MKVSWTARARTRLAELHGYIAQDSKPRALAMVERILDRAEALLVAPRSVSTSRIMNISTNYR
jgi:plasmid stabilization system protein ParE